MADAFRAVGISIYRMCLFPSSFRVFVYRRWRCNRKFLFRLVALLVDSCVIASSSKHTNRPLPIGVGRRCRGINGIGILATSHTKYEGTRPMQKAADRHKMRTFYVSEGWDLCKTENN